MSHQEEESNARTLVAEPPTITPQITPQARRCSLESRDQALDMVGINGTTPGQAARDEPVYCCFSPLLVLATAALRPPLYVAFFVSG